MINVLFNSKLLVVQACSLANHALKSVKSGVKSVKSQLGRVFIFYLSNQINYVL